MTIAIGLLCNDGLVIASDTEETWGDNTKRKTDKILIINNQRELTCVMSGAGSGHLMLMFMQAMNDTIGQPGTDHSATDWPGLIKFMRETMQDLWGRNIAPQISVGASPATLDMIVGFVLRGEARLFSLGMPDTILRIAKPFRTAIAIGIGLTTANPILDRLYSLETGKLPMAPAADVAAYALKHVKQAAQYCGGDSDVVLQGHDGSVNVLTGDYVKKFEKWAAQADTRAAHVLLHGTRADAKGIEHATQRLVSTMEEKPSIQLRRII